MNKRYSIFFVITILSVTTLAAESTFGFRLTGGNNFITNWNTDNEISDRLLLNNFSLGGGIIYSYSFNRHYSLNGEILFQKNRIAYKGSASSLSNYGITSSGMYTENYFYYSYEIPIYLCYSVDRTNNLLSFYGGFYLSLPETLFTGLNQEGEITYNGKTESFSSFPTTTEFIIPGITFGLTWDFPLNLRSKLQIDARYIFDFIQLNSLFNRSGIYLGINYLF